MNVVATLTARRPGLHVVVTGRNAKPELIAAADLVTEMTLVKHHFRRRREGASRASSSRQFMPARALMFQGTGSDVGKSLIVAGLARALTRRGLTRAPVQAAEHVEQRGRDRGRRRDRPRAGAAGARRAASRRAST